MSATPTVSNAGLMSSPWVRTLRLLAAVGLVWAVLHFLVGALLLPRGLDRPVSLAAAPNPVLAALVLMILLPVMGYVGQLMAGVRRWERGALLIVSLALALWGYGGGTVDQWLILSEADSAAPPSATPYVGLIAEYVFLAVVMALVAVAGDTGSGSTAGGRLRRLFGLDRDRTQGAPGWAALLIATVVIGVLMLLLTGPAVGRTLSGQVYFAVAVASAVGVFVATRFVKARESIWYWPAPILAGLVGMVVAAVRPDLLIPAEYRQLNSIPAWGLARALPVQMVGVGVAITIWTLRAVSGGSQPEED